MTNDAAPLDAERIFRVLLRVKRAPLVSRAVAARFAENSDEDDNVDQPAMNFLVEEDFVAIATNLSEAIHEHVALIEQAEPLRTEIQDLERRFKSLAVRLRHAERDRPLVPMFQSKKNKWEQANREGNIERDRDLIRRRQIELEEKLMVVRESYETLVQRIEKDPELHKFRWCDRTPIALTHHGEFLLDHLAEMQPRHFRGRPLTEIMVLGPMLA